MEHMIDQSDELSELLCEDMRNEVAERVAEQANKMYLPKASPLFSFFHSPSFLSRINTRMSADQNYVLGSYLLSSNVFT